MGLAPLSLAFILAGAVVVTLSPVAGAVLALVGLAFEFFLFLSDGSR